MKHWTRTDIPPLTGKLAVVTGTGGIGYETALALASAGCGVIIAGRDAAKGQVAVERIRRVLPPARVSFEQLDLASLASVTRFAERMRGAHDHLDLLINNAGVMTPPNRRVTQDGFELQLGTNYLGHFALTGLLLPLLRKGRAPRVVSVSSVAARSGRIDFEDLNAERQYDPMKLYSQSKLACLMFARELQRRSDNGGWRVTSVAAHPGVARTELLPNGAGRGSVPGLLRRFAWFLFQPASQGALPSVYAATAPGVDPGGYYGPDRLGETRGHPAPAKVPAAASDDLAAARLWEVSEELTRVRFGELVGLNQLALRQA